MTANVLPYFKAMGMRQDLMPFFDEKKTVGGKEFTLHIFFEHLDNNNKFESMLNLLTEEDEGYCKKITRASSSPCSGDMDGL